jgi:6-phosphogluconolactonase
MSIRTTSPSRQRAFANRMLALCLALVSAGTLSGCGGFWQPITSTTTTNTGTGDFVYVGKAGSSTLAGYVIGTGGSLTAIAATLTLAGPPTSLVISPNNEFLYAGTASGIYGYSISSTGTLTTLNSGTALASFSVGPMAISPDGNWLVAMPSSYVVGPGYLYPLSSTTGLIGNGSALSIPSGGTSEAVQFAPTEATATVSTIAASFGSAGVVTYTFGTNTVTGGAASYVQTLPVSTIVANASDNGLIWNSAGTAIYFVSGGADQTLYTYPVTSTTGVIGSVAGSVPTGVNPTALSFDQSGAYIYVTNTGITTVTAGTTISGYTVATSGSTTTFSPLSTSPFSAVGSAPEAIINAGDYILAVNEVGPPDLLLYTVDTTTAGRLYVTSSENTQLGGTLGADVVIAATN